MKVATLKLKWNKSVSSDVEFQKLVINLGDVNLTDIVLPASAEEYLFDADEKSFVHVSLIANDGYYDSDPLALDFYVPDLAKPAATTNLAFTIVEVKDKVDYA